MNHNREQYLKGQNALVTGGSRGIGKAIAISLAKHGANVAITYKSNHDIAEKVKEEIASCGVLSMAICSDVSDFASAKLLISSLKIWGTLSILVNNAGITQDKLLIGMHENDWKKVLDTNLTGTFCVTRAAIFDMMKKKYGSIINISSVSGITGMAGQSNYSAAKAGIIGFTKALAREIAPYNLTANVVAPGPTETDMIKTIPEKILSHTISQIPLGRIGQAEETAEAVAFLASPYARFITGQVLAVDGGLTM